MYQNPIINYHSRPFAFIRGSKSEILFYTKIASSFAHSTGSGLATLVPRHLCPEPAEWAKDGENDPILLGP
jgi:hypothetical protein